METLIIKKKEFEIIEEIKEDCFKVMRKGKTYFAKKFEPRSEKFDDYVYSANRIKSSLVLSPRMKVIDKKNGYIVSEFIEGQSVLEYLVDNDPSDDDLIYKQIFLAAHMAKVNGMVLNFKPDNWIITPKGLVYLKRRFSQYTKDKDFTQTDIRLWFITKDLASYAREHGYIFNVNRLKDEYVTNKHIVLVTCKHYQ